jgi:hypothetical protein
MRTSLSKTHQNATLAVLKGHNKPRERMTLSEIALRLPFRRSRMR